jgi:ribosomal-protein-alanine N-acetyltransferase
MIQTSRLQFINCQLSYFEALLQGTTVLSELLGVDVPENWTEYPEMILLAYDKLRNDPSIEKWFFYLAVHKEENRVIGLASYKGKPNAAGVVEIAYEISQDYRAKGYATEIAKALIEHAFSQEGVQKIIAHTLEEYNAAVKVLQKCGMQFAGNIQSEDSDTLWQWEITLERYQQLQTPIS